MKIEFNNPFKEFLGKDNTYNNTMVSSNKSKKKKSSKVYGKYYEEDVSAMEQRLTDIKDEKELREMQERWDIERVDLEEEISKLEKIVEQSINEEAVVRAKLSLHDLYEKYETCKKYETRLNSTAQLEFVKSILGTYGFVPITRADEIAKEYEDYILFSNEEYQKKEKKAENWGLALSFLGIFIYPLILGIVVWLISDPTELQVWEHFKDFPVMGIIMTILLPLITGLGCIYCIPVLNIIIAPTWLYLTFKLTQKAVDRVILGKNISKAKKERDKTTLKGAIIAGIGFGVSTTAHWGKKKK